MFITIILEEENKRIFDHVCDKLSEKYTDSLRKKYFFIKDDSYTIEDAIFELSVEKNEPDAILLHDKTSNYYEPETISNRCLYHFPNSRIVLIVKEEGLSHINFTKYSSVHAFLAEGKEQLLSSYLEGNYSNSDYDGFLINTELLNKTDKKFEVEKDNNVDVWSQSLAVFEKTPTVPKKLDDNITVKSILSRKRISGKIMLVVPSQCSVYGMDMVAAYPAIGVMSIAGILESAGHHVAIVDLDVDGIDNETLITDFDNGGFDILGVTSVTPTYPDAVKLAKLAKKHLPHIVTILGGIHATIDSSTCVKEKCFDFIAVGEAECTAVELVDAIMDEKVKDYSYILGIVYKSDGKIISTKPRELTPDLDDYPPPAYHLVRNLNKYQPADSDSDKVMPLMVSRGCPGLCTYCQTKNIFGRRTRFRSPDKVLEDIRLLVNDYDIKEIHFLDDVITANKRFVREFFTKLKNEPYKLYLQVANGLRADMVNQETLELLRDAGLSNVGFGIETGSERVAKIIKKGISKDRVRQAVLLAKNTGLDTWGFFIIGLPGDDEKSVEETIEFAIELNLKFAKFLILKPFPGTEVFYQLDERGLIDSRDYSQYGVYTSPVHHLEELSSERILQLQRHAFRRFYLRPSKIIEHILAINSLDKLKAVLFGAWFVFARIFYNPSKAKA